MKRTALLITVVLLFSVTLVGCKRGAGEKFLSSVISDWEVLSYYSGSEDGEYIGKYRENGSTYRFYELEGMDKNAYLNVIESSYMLATSNCEIYKNKRDPYPIMSYDAKRIDVKWNNVPQTVEDEDAVDALLDIIRSGEGTKTDIQKLWNTKIIFDLPCELSLTCHLKTAADGTFSLIYFDQRSGEYLSFDVTEVFKDRLW
ncbi:MAG: hypothetical protein IJO81_05320 [Clostridia bacterium]|nr:hypothetical protein [Clostridia bacterium]